MNNKYKFLDFHSYDSLLENKNISNKLVETYRNVFGDPDLWGENYSEDKVKYKLREELSGKAGLRLCMKGLNDDAELLGFCWAQYLDLAGVVSAIESIEYYQTLGSPDIRIALSQIIKDESVIYLHDLGITSAYRGQLPLQQLICPVLNSLAERSETQRLFFWSIKDSRIHQLAKFAGFELVTTVKGLQFFMGNIDTRRVQTLCR